MLYKYILIAISAMIYLSSAAVARPLEVKYERDYPVWSSGISSHMGSVHCTLASVPSVCRADIWETPKEEVPYWEIWDTELPKTSERNSIIQMLQSGSSRISNIEVSTIASEKLNQQKRWGRQILGVGMMLTGLIFLLFAVEWWLNRSEQYKFWKQYRRSI